MSSTIIDHAIAIPTRQRNVWEQMSDITNFPRWREDIQSVTFLTGKHEGRGTRFRTKSRRGAEQVVEITAWYEGLGYEYIVVDGSPYDNNRGRIRLQESTEGTIVQWTFSYELSGFLSGLRNSLSVRPGLDNEITDNLRNLYTYVKDMSGNEHFVAEQSKAFLQEAPDVLARSQYQPRYPSKSETNMPAVPENIVPDTGSIFEPPLSDDDTKPNPSVQTDPDPDAAFKPLRDLSPAPGVERMPEPDFLKDVPDLSGQAPPSLIPSEPLPRFPTDANDLQPLPADEPVPNLSSASRELNELNAQPEISEIEEPTLTDPAASYIEDVSNEGADAAYTHSQADLQHMENSDSDTSGLSVFEIFGLPKPSETENTRTLHTAPPIDLTNPEPIEPIIEGNTEQLRAFTDDEPIVPDVEPEDTPRRRGLRASLRRKSTRVRLPK